MRKTHLFAIALAAVCAFSALIATSAFALEFTLAEWLANGVAVKANLAATTEGELLFVNLLNSAAILCSGKFDGTVGENGVDQVTEVLRLNNTSVSEFDSKPTANTGIACEKKAICEGTPEIWPVGLPWSTLLELDTTETKWFDLAVPNSNGVLPGYLIDCVVLFVLVEELCQTVENTFGEVSNALTDVELLGAVVPEATCNGNIEDGEISNNAENVALISLNSGETLQVSE